MSATVAIRDCFRTHITTDKPIYKPSQSVRVRGTVLHAFSRAPCAAYEVEPFIEIKSPKGDTVWKGKTSLDQCHFGVEWQIPADQAGGDYTIKVYYKYNSDYTPAERKFNIRNFNPPRLKTQLKFLQKGYGPGDTAFAKLEVTRAEGGFPVGATVTAIARIDGDEAFRGFFDIDDKGVCVVKFQLPRVIQRGEGTLSCVVQDGGVVETAGKTIPILLQAVDCHVFPESGDLTSGVPSAFYIEAFTPVGDPADIEADVHPVGAAANARPLATVATIHEGRGRGEFTPQAGTAYELRVTRPASVTQPIPLPPARDGVALSALRSTFSHHEDITVRVAASTARGDVVVRLFKLEQQLAETTVSFKEHGSHDVALAPADMSGVLRVLVAEADTNVSLAERIVFRHPKEALSVTVTTDQETYVPAGTVNLTVRAKDASSGAAKEAWVSVTVADDTVLEMVEKRKQAPRLPAMALLEDEVARLDDAAAYLDAEKPNDAATNIDLLLGTQGWRRFVDANSITAAPEDQQDALKRVLVRHEAAPRFPHFGKLAGFNDQLCGAVPMPMALECVPCAMAPPPLAMPQMVRAAPLAMAPAPQPVVPAVAPPMAPPMAPPVAPPVAMQQAAGPPPPPPGAPMPPMRMEIERELMPARNRRMLAFAPPPPPIPPQDDVPTLPRSREYAHHVRPGRQPCDRVDFAELVFWNITVRTDANGEARCSFQLPDSVTTFRAFADAVADNGALGASDCGVKSVEPFYVEPKLPLEITLGDAVIVPIALVNGSSHSVSAAVAVTAKSADGPPSLRIGEWLTPAKVSLPPEARDRVMVRLDATAPCDAAALVVEAEAAPFSDKVERTTRVVPVGFPVAINHGGKISSEDRVRHTVTVPAEMVAGSLMATFKAYPTPAASLGDALKALIQEPSGCFEQTSMTTYPLVMAQQYFKTHDVDPDTIASASEKLERGYKRLVGYECKSGGFEWFGESPGHEALTAYGLLQFMDMSQVLPVDKAMLERTRAWLLSRRSGSGEYQRNTKALDNFGRAPDFVTNAYITWALVDAGEQVEGEVEWLVRECDKNKDAYLTGLTGATLYKLGRGSQAKPLAEKLVGLQREDGLVSNSESTITCSGGQAKDVETTAIAVICWLNDRAFASNAEKAAGYLASMCQNGRFSSTQATVLALKAILAFDAANTVPKVPGSIRLLVDGREVASGRFGPNDDGPLELTNWASALSGKGQPYVIEAEMVGGSPLNYALTVDFYTTLLPTSPECVVEMDARLASEQTREGEGLEVAVRLRNKTAQGQPMTVAIIGLPGGLEPRHTQLKELVTSKTVDFYETRGRQIILYWRSLAPSFETRFRIDVEAKVPGAYTGPASRVYLYYTDEYKQWLPGMHIDIAPKH